MKTAILVRLPKPSAITIFNIVVLVFLAILISNKVSPEHEAQIQSAVRSSHRFIKAAAEKRERVKDQRNTTTLTRFE